MSRRYPIPPLVQRLFCNLPLECGWGDARIVRGSDVRHKTFARLRNDPPRKVSCGQLRLIARLAQEHTGVSSADVLAAVRGRSNDGLTPLWELAAARTYSRKFKDLTTLERQIKAWLESARRIHLFDRQDSFGYLRPVQDHSPSEADARVRPPERAEWPKRIAVQLTHSRCQIRIVLTPGSLCRRIERFGDEGIERLIDCVDSDGHAVSVVDDAPRLAHRVLRGVFANSAAVAVFDRRAMVVLPLHGRAVRVYERNASSLHSTFIAHTLELHRRMRRSFCLHPQSRRDAVAHLHQHLSYHDRRRDIIQR